MTVNRTLGAFGTAVAMLSLFACSSDTTSTEKATESTVKETSRASVEKEVVAESEAQSGGFIRACQVTDEVGVSDLGFNQRTFEGVQRASNELGVGAAVLESRSETDYVSNMQAFIDEGCNIIITSGFLLGDATREAANANPDTPFSIVDYAYAEGEVVNNNVLSQVFNSDEAAFLAGYLAAGMSSSGKVGTFGGSNFPPVTSLMSSFYYGVQKFNADNGSRVEVLGWDPVSQSGLFTENFENLDEGRSYAQKLVDQGADIVMPVAGEVGRGSAALASELGADKLKIIGLDFDQYEADKANQNVYLTSVLKNLDVSTFNAIKSVVDGTFDGGVIIGNLENGGVGLAPFHNFDSAVPAKLRDQIEEVKAGIIDGSVSVLG